MQPSHDARPAIVSLDDMSLPQVAGVLAARNLYVGSDSGISHLAVAVGGPTIVLFGPSDPAV
jgi:ADP-heptose:LPS heptosyltransferase